MPKVKYTHQRGLVQESGAGFELIVNEAVISGSFKSTKNITLGRQDGNNASGDDVGTVTLPNPSGSNVLGGAQPHLQTLVWKWDQSEFSTVAAHTLKDPDGNALKIPPGVVALEGWVEVVTALDSENDNSTIKFGTGGDSNDDDGFLQAIAVADGPANTILAMDGAFVSGSGVTGLGHKSKRFTTHDLVKATIATEAMTAGKAYLYLLGYNSPG